MTKDEALKLALNVLINRVDANHEAITAIREALAQPEQEPVAWINWCAATGKRSVSFECESELASQPLYAGITQNTQDHYSKFHSWFDSELHRKQWIGLTQQEHIEIAVECGCMSSDWVFYGSTVERILKEKNS